MTDSAGALLGDIIFFFILFFTTSSMAFLFNLKYAYTYNYTRATAIVDIVVCAILVYLFSPLALGLLLLSYLLRTVRRSQ